MGRTGRVGLAVMGVVALAGSPARARDESVEFQVDVRVGETRSLGVFGGRPCRRTEPCRSSRRPGADAEREVFRAVLY